MLKSRCLELGGRDAGRVLRLTEQPALIADRAARRALHCAQVDPAGGVVALALQHMAKVRGLGACAIDLLNPFVSAVAITRQGPVPFAMHQLQDWRNVERIHDLALLLHVDFISERPPIEVPVALEVQARRDSSQALSFCSPFLATVLHSNKATYHELETSLSTEDAFNLVELLTVEAIREWKQAQKLLRTRR